MASHWLGEDGQLAIEIIWPIEWKQANERRRLARYGEMWGTDRVWFSETYINETWIINHSLDNHTADCILDHHAEEWLHERNIAVTYYLESKDWSIDHYDYIGDEYIEKCTGDFPDKSQAIIAAVLAAEEAK